MLTPEERKKIEYAASHLMSGLNHPEDAHAGDSIDLAWETFDELFSIRRTFDQGFGGPLMQNGRGEWVPAIPTPEYVGWMGRPKCTYTSAVLGSMPCGKKFWTPKEYEQHYALEHIVRGR